MKPQLAIICIIMLLFVPLVYSLEDPDGNAGGSISSGVYDSPIDSSKEFREQIIYMPPEEGPAICQQTDGTVCYAEPCYCGEPEIEPVIIEDQVEPVTGIIEDNVEFVIMPDPNPILVMEPVIITDPSPIIIVEPEPELIVEPIPLIEPISEPILVIEEGDKNKGHGNDPDWCDDDNPGNSCDKGKKLGLYKDKKK